MTASVLPMTHLTMNSPHHARLRRCIAVGLLSLVATAACLADVPKGLPESDWQSIRAAHEAGRHAFLPTATGWQAINPGQHWTTTFDQQGFIARPKDAAWTWGLALQSYGIGTDQHSVTSTPKAKAEGTRLSYRWDDIVEEWWVNDSHGLEHGFTLSQRPSEISALKSEISSPLAFTLSVRGTLTPHRTEDALGITFADTTGKTILTYAGLKVWDADGKVLPSHFAEVSGSTVRLLVDERGARYPLTVDPIAQQAFLKPAAVGTTQKGDAMGCAVAISGDTVVVGARSEDSSTLLGQSPPNELSKELSGSGAGAAYVYVRSSTGTWTQQAYLKPACAGTTQNFDSFGSAVAIHGDTIIIGAPNEHGAGTGVNPLANESTDLWGNGAAYIFVRTGTVWTQQAYLKPEPVTGGGLAAAAFGFSVAISGDSVLVGTSGAGALVYTRSAQTWTFQATLQPSAESGQYLSVALDGDYALIGDVGDATNGSFAGAACVFHRIGSAWTQTAYLRPPAAGNLQDDDQFGASVAISGDVIVVGAPGEDSDIATALPNEASADSGAAYVFRNNGTAWVQEAMVKATSIGTTAAGDRFGTSVGVSGDTIIVGAPHEASSSLLNATAITESAPHAGAAYVFTHSGSTWSEQKYLKPNIVGTTQALDFLGNDVAIDGSTVIAGATGEDSSVTNVATTRNESAPDAGAAYIFSGVGAVTPKIAVFAGASTSPSNQLTSFVGFQDFGDIAPATSSALKTFTIKNIGNASLVLTLPFAKSGIYGPEFTAANPSSATIAPGTTKTFTIKFTPPAGSSGLRFATVSISSNDPAQPTFDIKVTGTAAPAAPAAITTPLAHQIKLRGDSTSFSVAATGTNLSYTWYRNATATGTAISTATNPTANTPTLVLSGLTGAAAGHYSCRVTKTAAPTNSVFTAATLVVVDPNTAYQDVVAGATATFSQTVATASIRAWGPITSYAWNYNSSPITGPATKYSSYAATAAAPGSLKVLNCIDPTDEGDYTLSVTSPAGTLTSGPVKLRVLVAPIVDSIPSVTVAGPDEVSVSITGTNDPVTYTFSTLPTANTTGGLPNGLSFVDDLANPGFGFITGIPTVPGSWTITVKASNAAGTSLPETFTLTYTAIASSLVGTYVGQVPFYDPARYGGVPGGFLRFTLSSNGAFSFVLKLGNTTLPPQTGQFVPNGQGIEAYANLPGDELGLYFGVASHPSFGFVLNCQLITYATNQYNGFIAALPTPTPIDYAGNYTFVTGMHPLAAERTNPDVPQGYGLGWLKVAADGTYSGMIKLPDDPSTSAYTFLLNGVVGQVGQYGYIPIFTTLYGNTGSFTGELYLSAAGSSYFRGTQLGWTKLPQTSTTQYFKAGFSLTHETVVHLFTMPTVSTSLAMGASPGPNNVSLSVTDPTGTLPVSRFAVDGSTGSAYTVLSTLTSGLAQLSPPLPYSVPQASGGHAQISGFSLRPGYGSTFTLGVTGLVKGSFTLTDANLLTQSGLPYVVRSNPFRALIHEWGGTPLRAYGHCLLQDRPAVAGETITTTKYRSGIVSVIAQ